MNTWIVCRTFDGYNATIFAYGQVVIKCTVFSTFFCLFLTFCTTLLLHVFNVLLSGTTWVSRYQKGKTNLDILEQEIVSDSGISWTICKSAPRPRQIIMPAPHHSDFYRPDAFPATQPTGCNGMGMCCEKKTMIGLRNVWSMKWRIPDQEVDERGLGERLYKKTAKHIY